MAQPSFSLAPLCLVELQAQCRRTFYILLRRRLFLILMRCDLLKHQFLVRFLADPTAIVGQPDQPAVLLWPQVRGCQAVSTIAKREDDGPRIAKVLHLVSKDAQALS